MENISDLALNIGIRKGDELFKVLIELQKQARIRNVKITEIELPISWLTDTEIKPEKVLGIKIV